MKRPCLRLLDLVLGLALSTSLLLSQETKPATPSPTPLEKAVAGAKLPLGFKYEILVMGGIPEPLALKFCPDGRLWFTGRRGNIWAYDFKTQTHKEIAQL